MIICKRSKATEALLVFKSRVNKNIYPKLVLAWPKWINYIIPYCFCCRSIVINSTCSHYFNPGVAHCNVRITWRACQSTNCYVPSPGFWFSRSRLGLQLYTFNKLPKNIDGTGSGTTLWEPLTIFFYCCSSTVLCIFTPPLPSTPPSILKQGAAKRRSPRRDL